MHIVCVISKLQLGGAERVLTELANYWVSKNNKISIVTFENGEIDSFYQLDSKVEIIQLAHNNSYSEGFVKRIARILRRILYLRNTLKHNSPDVILSFIEVTNITTLIAAIGLKTPVVVSERTHPKYYKIPIFYNFLRVMMYLFANKIVVQTKDIAQYFKWINKNKIEIISNYIKRSNNTIQISQDSQVQNIISVGRLCPNKDFDILIKAFALVAQAYSNLKLTIYGDGAARNQLLALINELCLSNKVFLPGAVSNIHEALLQADLFVFPSRYEGFPNALGEAMGVGLPVIASDRVGNVELVKDKYNGRLFPVGDTNSLYKIISELIEDNSQREQLSKNAKKIVDEYNEEEILGMWDTVITDVCL